MPWNRWLHGIQVLTCLDKMVGWQKGRKDVLSKKSCTSITLKISWDISKLYNFERVWIGRGSDQMWSRNVEFTPKSSSLPWAASHHNLKSHKIHLKSIADCIKTWKAFGKVSLQEEGGREGQGYWNTLIPMSAEESINVNKINIGD